MRIVATFNPQTATFDNTQNAFGGTANPQLPSGDAILVIRNKSNYDLIFTFVDGSTFLVESGLARKYFGSQADWRIKYKISYGGILQNMGSAALPYQNVIIEYYNLSEPVVEVYPTTLSKVWVPQLNDFVIDGQMFTASTGRLAAAALNIPLSISNSATSGGAQYAMVVEASVAIEGGTTNVFLQNTSSSLPAWSTVANVINNNLVGGVGGASNMKVFYSPTTQTGPSRAQQIKGLVAASNTNVEMLNKIPFILAPITGFVTTFILWSSGNTGSTNVTLNLVWVEF